MFLPWCLPFGAMRSLSRSVSGLQVSGATSTHSSPVQVSMITGWAFFRLKTRRTFHSFSTVRALVAVYAFVLNGAFCAPLPWTSARLYLRVVWESSIFVTLSTVHLFSPISIESSPPPIFGLDGSFLRRHAAKSFFSLFPDLRGATTTFFL